MVLVYETSGNWSRIGDNQWVSDQYLKVIDNVVIPSTAINEGDIVQILASADRYVTGEKIPAFVKGVNYTVRQKVKNKILLKEINSWVYEENLTK